MTKTLLQRIITLTAIAVGYTTAVFAGVPEITSPATAEATLDVPFNYQITTTEFTATGLPAGLSIDSQTGIISGTPTTFGSSNVSITATNADGVATTNVTITIAATFTAWQQLHFSESELIDPEVSSELANPSGDGIPNVIKYALNLDPHVSETGRLPTVEIASSGDLDYLTLTFNQLKSATGITISPEVSQNLVQWDSAPDKIVTISVTDNPDGATQQVVVRSTTPLSANNKQFIRLQIQ